MNREEAVLRELNLYPLWQRRGGATPPSPNPVGTASPFGRGHGEKGKEERDSAGEGEVDVRINKRDEQPVGELDWPGLKAGVRDCTACGLRAACAQTVFGVGDENADWLFVGEAPGADEDARGEPFVGQAGKLLDNMLMAIRLKRDKNVYIANIVKCRPPGNRNPEADEIATCLPYLRRQIELIRPKIIVALGKVAANALLREDGAEGVGRSPARGLGKEATVASLRGRLHDYHVAPAAVPGVNQEDGGSRPPLLMELPATQPGEPTTLARPLVAPRPPTSPHRVGVSIPLVITYHPAYLLRTPSDKARAWQDLCLAVKTMKG